MATSGTATAALERALHGTATCTYVLWVPPAEARDTALARRRWVATLAEWGFVECSKPTLETVGGEWYLVGSVRPA